MVYQDGYTTGSLLGDTWKYVDEWPEATRLARRGSVGGEAAGRSYAVDGDVDDDAEYETEEEVIYVTLDLGNQIDRTVIGTAADYQLIGLDTPTPFLRLGDHVFAGEPGEMIGDELVLHDVRDPTNPIRHSHNPIATTHSLRITFDEVTLIPKNHQDNADANETQLASGGKAAAASPVPQQPRASSALVARPDALGVIPHDGRPRDNQGRLYSMKEAKRRPRKKVATEGGADDVAIEAAAGPSVETTKPLDIDQGNSGNSAVAAGSTLLADVADSDTSKASPSAGGQQPKRLGRPKGSKTKNRKVPLSLPSLFGSRASPSSGTATPPTVPAATAELQSMSPEPPLQAMSPGSPERDLVAIDSDTQDEAAIAQLAGIDPATLARAHHAQLDVTDRDWLKNELKGMEAEPREE